MAQEYLGILGTILGTIMGFSLNAYNNWRIEKNREQKQVKSVRLLINLEIDQNLSLLRDFWDTLNIESYEYKDYEEIWKRHYAKMLINMPLSKWRNINWKNHNSLLPITFNEREINEISNFYNNLENISSIRSSLSYLKSVTDEDWRGLGRKKLPHSSDAKKHWDEFEKIALETLEKGNPLINDFYDNKGLK